MVWWFRLGIGTHLATLRSDGVTGPLIIGRLPALRAEPATIAGQMDRAKAAEIHWKKVEQGLDIWPAAC